MQTTAEKSVRVAGLAAAGALTIGAVAGCFPDYDGLAAPIAALALPAMAFSAGAIVSARITRLSRRPFLGVAALFALTPFAPILPGFATLFAAGLFAILGLFAAGLIEPIVAALARERTASVFGSLFIAAVAGVAIAAGQIASPLMPTILALCGTVIALAWASVFVSRED